MEGIEEDVKNLEICSYRYLQQVAKAMSLPSNVKKVRLIKLINTKKYGTQQEVDELVKQVRQERQQLSQVRRKANKNRKKTNVQSTEISSTSNSLSPPITTTPIHTRHVVIRYSPEKHSPKKYPETISTRKYNLSRSDRVLRSFNRVKKPSYLLNNTLFNLINGSDTEDGSEVLNILNAEKTKQVDRFPKKTDDWKMHQLVPLTRSVHTSPPRARVQRRISGVYPLRPEELKVPNVAIRRADGSISKLRAIIQRPLSQRNLNYDRQSYNGASLLRTEASEHSYTATTSPQFTYNSTYPSSMTEITPNVNYRQSNLKIETQNLDNRPSNYTTTPTFSFRSINTSEIAHSISYRTTNMTEMTQSINYRVPNNSAVNMPENSNSSKSSDEMNMSNVYKENQPAEYSVYYHKKIRAEQVRSSRNRDMFRTVENDGQLPKINEVFSKFNSVYSKDIMQPLYVHVDNEPEIAPITYIPDPTTSYQGSSGLEKLYNMKTAFPPLLRICTTTNTRTVYSTPIITSAKAQPPNPMHLYNDALAPRDNQQYYVNEEGLPRVHDFFRNFHGDDGTLQDRHTTEDFRRSCSSIETLPSQEQELGANVTIPEMVEDALELISQDGDYMERMGMDIRMQCILCNWAGPKIILEYHIRKEHSEQIIQCSGNEWVATYTLGGLCARRSWVHRVLQTRGELYVISVQYHVPECFMAALSTLSEDDPPKTGSLTIYNRLTGEPFVWQGEVSEIDTDMDVKQNCLRIPLSRMDLLPNSANLQLTSRVLDSTFRYVKFIKKLRALEEEQSRGAVNKLKEEKDKQYSDFFIRCDRRSLINNVARRVDLCLMSYQEDLKAKRQRLVDLLTAEEEMNIRKFVEQAQAGAEAVWQDKKDRLAYLLDKRQKEHEEKYKDVPISKCVHVHPCIVKMRCKEMSEVQKYQIKDNEAKRMSEIELDKMWHEVAMKESEALAARLELDAIERLRRTHECLRHSDEQVALRQEQRRRDQERLKQESLKIKQMFEENRRKEDEDSRKLQEKRLETARERNEMIKERQETLEKQQAETKLINDTWDSLAGMGLADEKNKEALRRKKQMELDICNQRISKIKRDKVTQGIEDAKVLDQEMKRQQDVIDKKRCAHIIKTQKMREEVRTGIIEQIKDNALARERKAREDDDQVEYQRQVFKQVEELVKHKELTEAQARKIFQSQLLEQIDYNKLLKERARLEELDQLRKCEKAADDYQFEITKILCRLFFSEEIHPFMKKMYKGLKMPEKCPCSKPDYCAVGPKPITGGKTHSVPVLGPKGEPNAPQAGPGPSTPAVPGRKVPISLYI
uniref:Uncharacterized protein n=1 Tax=Heliothis virescens TaxID=7102 RepID=A0A2A4JSE0_HELVI